MYLLSIQTQWMMFTKTLMIISQTEKEKFQLFGDMIADIMGNKKFQAIIKNCFLDAEN